MIRPAATSPNIGAGTETPPGAGYNHYPDVIVLGYFIHRSDQAVGHLPAKGVQLLRLIQGYGRNIAVSVQQQFFIGHVVTSTIDFGMCKKQ